MFEIFLTGSTKLEYKIPLCYALLLCFDNLASPVLITTFLFAQVFSVEKMSKPFESDSFRYEQMPIAYNYLNKTCRALVSCNFRRNKRSET